MSRIGNSLDNREAEYFFSNIKQEDKIYGFGIGLLSTNQLIVMLYLTWNANKRAGHGLMILT